MTLSDEIRRLEEGPHPDEEARGIGIVSLLGLCDRDALEVVERVREVLRIVLAASQGGWPTAAEWRQRLPGWFVAASAPETTREEAERWVERWRAMSLEERANVEERQRWSIEDWLHWLRPAERQWELWACGVDDRSTVRLSVQIDALPMAHGALDWLLRAAGAARIVADEGD